MDVLQYTVQYLICWPLGRTAKSEIALSMRIVVKYMLIFGRG